MVPASRAAGVQKRSAKRVAFALRANLRGQIWVVTPKASLRYAFGLQSPDQQDERTALVIVPAGGSLESKSEAFGHCKSYALRATLLHSSLTGGWNDDQGRADQEMAPLSSFGVTAGTPMIVTVKVHAQRCHFFKKWHLSFILRGGAQLHGCYRESQKRQRCGPRRRRREKMGWGRIGLVG